MSLPKQPLSIRNLKARLRILKRPNVWGSVVVFLVAIVLLTQYLSRSEQLGRTTASSPASLDTDIDGLPIDDGVNSGQLPLPIQDLLNNPNGADAESQGNDLDPLAAATDAATGLPTGQQTQPPGQPLLGANQELLNLNLPDPQALLGFTADSNGQPLPSSLPNSGRLEAVPVTGQAPPPANLLQSALQRYPTSPAVSTNNEGLQPQRSSSPALEANTPSGQQAIPAPALVQPLPPTILPSQTPFQMSPPPGTTGYTMPNSLRTPVAPAINSGYPSVPGAPTAPQIAPNALPVRPGISPQTLQTPNYALPQVNTTGSFYQAPGATENGSTQNRRPASSRVLDSFSNPGVRPGRYIGGGEINTFSNP